MQGNPQPPTLNQRLDRLEKSNRRWRAVALMAAIGFSGLLFGQAVRPGGSMTLDELIIQDSQGRRRIRMYTRKGDARLELYDKQGKLRIASIAAADNRAAIVQYDAHSQERIVHGTGSAERNSRASVEHYDAQGNPRVAVYTQGSSRSGIDLYDAKQKKRLAAVTQGSESGFFGYDLLGKLRFNFITNQRGDAGLIFKDPAGRNCITVGTNVEGEARYEHWGFDKNEHWTPVRQFP